MSLLNPQHGVSLKGFSVKSYNVQISRNLQAVNRAKRRFRKKLQYGLIAIFSLEFNEKSGL